MTMTRTQVTNIYQPTPTRQHNLTWLAVQITVEDLQDTFKIGILKEWNKLRPNNDMVTQSSSVTSPAHQ